MVYSDGLEKPGIERATLGLLGKRCKHCTMEASRFVSLSVDHLSFIILGIQMDIIV